jgi:hypothetical protein
MTDEERRLAIRRMVDAQYNLTPAQGLVSSLLQDEEDSTADRLG